MCDVEKKNSFFVFDRIASEIMENGTFVNAKIRRVGNISLFFASGWVNEVCPQTFRLRVVT